MDKDELRHQAKEKTYDPDTIAFLATKGPRFGASRPATPLQALMEAAPGEEPVESVGEQQERFEHLRDALETGVLTPREIWVIEAYYYRGLSFREIASELNYASHTYVERVRNRALKKLRLFLEADQT